MGLSGLFCLKWLPAAGSKVIERLVKLNNKLKDAKILCSAEGNCRVESVGSSLRVTLFTLVEPMIM